MSTLPAQSAAASEQACSDQPHEQGSERRRHSRTPAKDLTCLLGEVMDISEGGALIHHRGRFARKPGEEFTALFRHDNHCIVLRMRVVRHERAGYHRHNIGVQFVDLDEDQRTELALLADAAHDAYIGPQAFVA